MQVKVNDTIKIIKEIGTLKVGDEFKVNEIDNEIIHFQNNVGCGGISENEFDNYFTVVNKENTKEKENAIKFQKGDKVIMTKTTEGLAPAMNIGDIFTVVSINDFGVAHIENNRRGHQGYFIADTILDEYFEKYVPVTETKIPETIHGTISATVTNEEIKSLLNGAKIDVCDFFDKCTIVAVQLTNGFVIVEYSACVNPDNYDLEIGLANCFKKIVDKVWELEGYSCQKQFAANLKINNKSVLSEDGVALKFNIDGDECTAEFEDYENLDSYNVMDEAGAFCRNTGCGCSTTSDCKTEDKNDCDSCIMHSCYDKCCNYKSHS